MHPICVIIFVEHWREMKILNLFSSPSKTSFEVGNERFYHVLQLCLSNPRLQFGVVERCTQKAKKLLFRISFSDSSSSTFL
jgi:hypothetical protein